MVTTVKLPSPGAESAAAAGCTTPPASLASAATPARLLGSGGLAEDPPETGAAAWCARSTSASPAGWDRLTRPSAPATASAFECFAAFAVRPPTTPASAACPPAAVFSAPAKATSSVRRIPKSEILRRWTAASPAASQAARKATEAPLLSLRTAAPSPAAAVPGESRPMSLLQR
uniref:Uncharacterized protein n=1 Tax=Macrostomum lignano TaxID=282301 RepID=A0A1I8H0V8_9PLAT